MEPTEITKDCDNGKEVASFEYYAGIRYAKDKQLIQNRTVSGSMFNKEGFVVTCGYVMTQVEPTDFPHIERRVI